MTRLLPRSILFVCLSMLAACDGQLDPQETYSGPNPFLKYQGEFTEDTGYINLRGQELHVTLEGDVEAPEYRILEAPAEQAQFALINLKKRGSFYLELLAEDSTSSEKVEWLVEGEWLDKTAARQVDQDKLKHFRMRDINAVVMQNDYRNIEVGKVYQAVVPKKPYSIKEDADDKCADYNSHISLSQSTYWYLWNPSKSSCPDEISQNMSVTVTELLPDNPESYPEYDQLWADKKLSVAVFFGKLDDDGDITEDTNYRYFEKFCEWLEEAGFTETSEPPEEEELPGIRTFKKTAGELTELVSVIGPHLFEGVNDWGNFDTWQEIVSSHEIIHYDGHSQMGSGMVFEQVDYPDFYQVFQVASCLSYEYYVRPILAGKGSWDSVDVLSNVKSTFYPEGLPLVGAFLAKLFWGFENQGKASWQDVMQAVSNELGHTRFGVSGARGNCFHPDGNLCENRPERQRFTNDTSLEIPDNDTSGVISRIQVDGSFTIGTLQVELDIRHSYIGDLTVTLTHNEVVYALWDQAGGGDDDIRQTFRPDVFNGLEAVGTWQLNVTDRANLDQGALHSWALVITPSE